MNIQHFSFIRPIAPHAMSFPLCARLHNLICSDMRVHKRKWWKIASNSFPPSQNSGRKKVEKMASLCILFVLLWNYKQIDFLVISRKCFCLRALWWCRFYEQQFYLLILCIIRASDDFSFVCHILLIFGCFVDFFFSPIFQESFRCYGISELRTARWV